MILADMSNFISRWLYIYLYIFCLCPPSYSIFMYLWLDVRSVPDAFSMYRTLCVSSIPRGLINLFALPLTKKNNYSLDHSITQAACWQTIADKNLSHNYCILLPFGIRLIMCRDSIGTYRSNDGHFFTQRNIEWLRGYIRVSIYGYDVIANVTDVLSISPIHTV